MANINDVGEFKVPVSLEAMKFNKENRRTQMFERELRLANKKKKQKASTIKRRESNWKNVFAQAMREFPTPAEKLCKATLEYMGFRHQAIVLGYIPDFTHFAYRIIVEIDGSIHNKKREEDAYRDEVFKSHQWRVLRFTNEQVNKNPEHVYKTVKAAIDEHSRRTL